MFGKSPGMLTLLILFSILFKTVTPPEVRLLMLPAFSIWYSTYQNIFIFPPLIVLEFAGLQF